MADDGLRDRLARQGEDALGKLAQDLLENPLVNGAITRAFSAREHAEPGAGGRARRAQHPLGGRRRAPDAAPAVGLAAPRGHRGRRRPARRADRHARQPTPASARALDAIETAISKLAAEVSRAQRRRPGAHAARAGAPRGRQAGRQAGPQAREEVELAERRRRDRPDRALGGLELLEPDPRLGGDDVADRQHAPRGRPRGARPRRRASRTPSPRRAPRPPPSGRSGPGPGRRRGRRRRSGPGGRRRRRRPATPAGRGRAAASRSPRAPGWCRPRRARRRRPGPRRARARRRSRRRCRPAPGAARRAGSAPRRRSPCSARPSRCSGSSAARRRARRPCSPTARGCG